MKQKTFVLVSLISFWLLPVGIAAAVDLLPVQGLTVAREQDRIYGSQYMTHEERVEYHAKKRAAKTKEEREIFRKEYYQPMLDRAKARGITSPDEPPLSEAGMDLGSGSGDMRQGSNR